MLTETVYTVHTIWMCCVFAWRDWNCFIPAAQFKMKMWFVIWFDLGKMIHDLRIWFEIWFVIWHKDLNLFLKWFVIWHYDLICDFPITVVLESPWIWFSKTLCVNKKTYQTDSPMNHSCILTWAHCWGVSWSVLLSQHC